MPNPPTVNLTPEFIEAAKALEEIFAKAKPRQGRSPWDGTRMIFDEVHYLATGEARWTPDPVSVAFRQA